MEMKNKQKRRNPHTAATSTHLGANNEHTHLALLPKAWVSTPTLHVGKSATRTPEASLRATRENERK